MAYINADTIMSGNHSISILGSSSLKKVMFDAAKFVPNPNTKEVEVGRKNTYDTWYETEGKREPT